MTLQGPKVLLLTLVLAGAVYGSGVSGPAAVVPLGDRDTLPLVATESLVFLGFSGDFAGDAEVRFRALAGDELGLVLVGSPIRSSSDKSRLVWAVRTDDPVNLGKRLVKPFKEKGYAAQPLRATALSVLGGQSDSDVLRGMRDLDRSERRVWAFYQDGKESLLWVFHEPKLAAEKLVDEVRDRKLKVGFYHQELELQAKEDADVQALAQQATGKLDLARASNRGRFLVLDVYLRDVDAFLALDRGKKTMACPDVLTFLQDVPAGKLSWVVTLENRGYPFVMN
ncbi:MAG: hypothetical protein EYC70_08320 [Planctomycetota bacterium]|nr:MAG: hypothetical protein EYC70_08320 [Planctomycetota bacterium]